MRVLLLTPWNNSWVPAYRKVFEKAGHKFFTKPQDYRADVALFMWADPAMFNDQAPRGKKNIVFMRRYEFFTYPWQQFDWDRIDAMVFVNGAMKNVVDRWADEVGVSANTHLIRNGLIPEDWPFQEHKSGTRIGMACHVHPKKNLPLAVQILHALPRKYSLDIAGDVQDGATAEYLLWLAHRLGLNLRLHGHVDDIRGFWSHHDYCLSTSISEGNPMNIIEAMLMGVKPIIHAWPDAESQFSFNVFQTVHGAADLIVSEEYDSHKYRKYAVENYGKENLQRVVKLAEGLHDGESTATDRPLAYETYP